MGVVFSELCSGSFGSPDDEADTVVQPACDDAMLTFGSLEVISWKLWNAFRDIIFVARTKSFKYS